MFAPSTSRRTRPVPSARARLGRRRDPAATLARPVVEPLEGRILLAGRPPYNTGTGFYVVGRDIYDANGNEFDIRGFNVSSGIDPGAAEIANTQANAIRVNFLPDSRASTPAARAAVVQEYISEGIVPIVEDHAATSQMDLDSLNAVVNTWLEPANVQWLKQDEKYIILDIANEWGPADYTWAEGYESAIARLRAAGINCLLMVDAGGYGQDMDDILTWGQQVLDCDPQKNVVFDIHMYDDWTTEDDSQIVGTAGGNQPYDMDTELLQAVADDLPLVVGEFASAPSTIVSTFSTERAMQIYESLDIGWLAWSWSEMVPGPSYQYTSDADLTPFGNLIINDPTYGIKATSRRASIFPPGITETPGSGLETTQAGGTASFTVELDSPPAADVTIPFSSSDTTEGTVSPASLRFTPADWNVPQTVTVTGVNDGIDQGNVAYTIVPGAATSQDPNYNGLVASDVAATNIDTDGAVQIVDNGHAGWSDVGPWMPSGPGGGYGGDSDFIGPGIGANTATWSFAVAPGLYSIATTWLPSSGDADNAPYTILNNGTSLGLVRLDQQEAPNSFSADGSGWEDLGTFVVSGGTLQVQLSDDADGEVVADAVQIQRLSSTIVSVAAAPASVPAGGTTGLVYTFTRAGATGGALTVGFGVGGTAVYGTDYTETGAATFGATSGTVTFAAGSATATVPLTPVAGDVVDGDESVILTVAAGSGYAAGPPDSAAGLLTDEDAQTHVTVAASPASVPADGTAGLVYTFTRTGPTGSALTTAFGVGGTAVYGTDYTESGAATFGATSGTVTFAAGSATAAVTLFPTTGSALVDEDQSVILSVAAGGAYSIASPSSATGTIAGVRVTVAVSPSSVTEDSTSGMVYTFTRTGAAAGPLTVGFGVGGTAVYGTDYTEAGAATFGATSGTVTFAAGSSTATVTLTPVAEDGPELDRTAVLTVSYGSGYGIGPARVATGTIVDEYTFINIDCFPGWVARDGENDLVYTLSRTGSTADALTVSFGVGGTAALGVDYTESGAATFGAASGTVTFAAGSATATVTLAPMPASGVGPNETAVLTVSAGGGYNVGGDGSATGIITDTSATVSVAVSPALVVDDGPEDLVYTFTRTGSTAGPLTAGFGVGGTAVYGTNYTETGATNFGGTSGTVTFAAGSATATVTLVPINLNAFGSNTTAVLSVAAGPGCLIGLPDSATGTIANDDYVATASFVQRDAITQGSWIGAYGSQGEDIAGESPALPSFAIVNVTGASTNTWAASTSDPRALQTPGGSGRAATTWYSATSFTIDLRMIDLQPHEVTLYALDWDNRGRQEQVQVIDFATGQVLDTESISNFSGGVYLQWSIRGHVLIKVTNTGPVNAVISGLFLDPVPTTASFLAQDATTQGTWIGAYGAQGYDIAAGAESLPSYAIVGVTGASTTTWAASTGDPRAPQVPGGSGRAATCWYSSTGFTIDVDFTDAQVHELALYALDWDDWDRQEQIQLVDATNGDVLDTESISNFSGGVYLQWAVAGHVEIEVTNEGYLNAVVSGLFIDPAPTTASFVKRDATTQGSWIGAYGAQGDDIATLAPGLPSYATVGLFGAGTTTWASSTTDARALQVPGGSGRAATAWYSATSFTINVNFTDGQVHELALYALDWDNRGRKEQVQLINFATGQVLDTETISGFNGGAYLQWAVTGHVRIVVTNEGPVNAVISGLFIDPTPSTAASFVKQDATTQGNWIGAYGAQGDDIATEASGLPSYAAVGFSGAGTTTWASSTTDVRALQTPGGSGRAATAWFSATSFTINVNFTDGQVHELALYALDWDKRGRQEQIQVINDATGQVLDTETISNFGAGVYLQWSVTGHLRIVVTNEGPVNAVISGLFIDPPPSTTQPTATAAFVGSDATTQGSWIGTYGAQGDDIAAETPGLPSYATISLGGAGTTTWTSSTSDVRALQVPGGSGRAATTWYSSTSFTITLDLTGGQEHDVELYALDWDRRGRSEQIQVLDAGTGDVLSTESISNFGGGVYLNWTISGDVEIKVTNTGPVNAVISGLFLDPPPSTAPPTATATFLEQDTATQGTWINTYGAQGDDIAAETPALPSSATVSLSGAGTTTWASGTTDVRALQVPGGSGRAATTWYSSASFIINLDLTDGQEHDVELYALDWDRRGRSEQIQILDAGTGKVLSSESVSNFGNGVYLNWEVSGDVEIKVTNTGPVNAVLSGLFLDPPSSGSSADLTHDLALEQVGSVGWRRWEGSASS